MGYAIYTLTDPRDNQVRYVGMSLNPEQRYREHLALNDYSPAKEDWLRTILALGIKPVMSIVDRADSKQDAHSLEAYWMLHYHQTGAILLNKEIVSATSGYAKENLVARLNARSNGFSHREVIDFTDLHRLQQENEQLKSENLRLRGLLGQYRNLLDPLMLTIQTGEADKMQEQASNLLDA